MDRQRRHDHVTSDPERCNPREKSYDHAHRAQELRYHRQEGKGYWDAHFLVELCQHRLETAAKPSQNLLGPMREHDHAERYPDDQRRQAEKGLQQQLHESTFLCDCYVGFLTDTT